MDLAEEIKQGKDELYNENATNVDELYGKAKTQLDKQLEVQREFAILEQQMRNDRLYKLVLEGEIEEVDEKKIAYQQKSQRARK